MSWLISESYNRRYCDDRFVLRCTTQFYCFIKNGYWRRKYSRKACCANCINSGPFILSSFCLIPSLLSLCLTMLVMICRKHHQRPHILIGLRKCRLVTWYFLSRLVICCLFFFCIPLLAYHFSIGILWCSPSASLFHFKCCFPNSSPIRVGRPGIISNSYACAVMSHEMHLSIYISS